ncbi:MAG: hypothetical protein WD690_00190 [Vicinamibacterales bacterium]
MLLAMVAGLIPLGYAAYVLFREQPPRLVSVTPSRTEPAPELRMTVIGENFRPYMRVSAGSQQAKDFVFKSTTEAAVWFEHLPPGEYDVILYDQAQERSRLPGALSVGPSSLPPTEIIAIGSFGNLDAAGAATITAGLQLPGVGEVVAVGKSTAGETKVFAGPNLVIVPVENALQVPAVVLLRCQVRSQQGHPHCVVNDATVAPTALMTLPTPLGKTPFQIDQVRSPHPLVAAQVELRVSGGPSVLALIAAGDVDLGGTSNPLALIARVASAGPVRRLSETSAEIDIRLSARLQRVAGEWLYNSTPLRAGAGVVFRTSKYEVQGVVTQLPTATDERGRQ